MKNICVLTVGLLKLRMKKRLMKRTKPTIQPMLKSETPDSDDLEKI